MIFTLENYDIDAIADMDRETFIAEIEKLEFFFLLEGQEIEWEWWKSQASRHLPFNIKIIPSLNEIMSWLLIERQIVANWQSKRARLERVDEATKARTLVAAKRIKELEIIIKAHYMSAKNAASPTTSPRNS